MAKCCLAPARERDMAYGGTDYSCNSVLLIRSPLGEVRVGEQQPTHPSARPFRPLVRGFIRIREAFAQRRITGVGKTPVFPKRRPTKEIGARSVVNARVGSAEMREAVCPLLIEYAKKGLLSWARDASDETHNWPTNKPKAG
jgi:hypothetical protein